jgi:RNA polymerase sigma-70 factor (ECF subfamily)
MANNNYDECMLIEQARQDRQAFGELYEMHVDRIYNYVYYRTGNQHDAEDLTARVFFRAAQHISHYQDQGAPFAAWLFAITRNMLANWYRDSGKWKLIPFDNMLRQQVEDGPEYSTEKGQDRELLLAAIRRLPAERQDLLILKFVERMTNSEIGQMMGRSEGAIKSLYHRTLSALRDDITGPAGNENNGGGKDAYRNG